MKQIRIQSDGTSFDTVISTESGEELKVTRATIWMEANEINKVDLEIVAPKLDLHGFIDTISLACPYCKEVEVHECDVLKKT